MTLTDRRSSNAKIDRTSRDRQESPSYIVVPCVITIADQTSPTTTSTSATTTKHNSSGNTSIPEPLLPALNSSKSRRKADRQALPPPPHSPPIDYNNNNDHKHNNNDHSRRSRERQDREEVKQIETESNKPLSTRNPLPFILPPVDYNSNNHKSKRQRQQRRRSRSNHRLDQRRMLDSTSDSSAGQHKGRSMGSNNSNNIPRSLGTQYKVAYSNGSQFYPQHQQPQHQLPLEHSSKQSSPMSYPAQFTGYGMPPQNGNAQLVIMPADMAATHWPQYMPCMPQSSLSAPSSGKPTVFPQSKSRLILLLLVIMIIIGVLVAMAVAVASQVSTHKRVMKLVRQYEGRLLVLDGRMLNVDADILDDSSALYASTALQFTNIFDQIFAASHMASVYEGSDISRFRIVAELPALEVQFTIKTAVEAQVDAAGLVRLLHDGIKTRLPPEHAVVDLPSITIEDQRVDFLM